MSWMFAISLFVSAALLFLIQPMIGKVVLAKFGGIPAVWLTCMLFFQAALLAGYAYVHSGARWLGTRRQALVHVAILLLPLVVLPLGWLAWPFAAAPLSIPAAWAPPGDSHPIPWLLFLLFVIIGAPFFALATTAPLLKKWFATTDRPSAGDPYYLYAASNLGSLAALLGYPVLCEPMIGLSAQGWIWLFGYGAAIALILGCLALARPSVIQSEKKSEPVLLAPADEPPAADLGSAITAEPFRIPSASDLPSHDVVNAGDIGAVQRLLWVARAFVPSSLLLGVTTYLTTDLAPVPLLWVVPLAIYLATFILAFARLPALTNRLFALIAPPVVLALLFVMQWDETQVFLSQGRLFIIHLAVFFVVSMACHGALAQTRPAASKLTEFYLWISVGGVLGGVFNAVVAPLIFRGLAEYSLALVLACLVLPARSRATPSRWRIVPDLGITLAMLIATSVLLFSLPADRRLELIRFGNLLPEERSWLTGFALLCLAGAVIAPLLARRERFSSAVDFALPIILIYWTARQASAIEPTSAQLFTMLSLELALSAAVAGLIVIHALKRQPWACAILGWPLFFGLVMAVILVRVWLSLDTSDGLGYVTVGRLNSIITLGFPLWLALVSADRPIRFGLSVGAVLLAGYLVGGALGGSDHILYRERNFFGISKVEKMGPFHRLVHGTTLHGMQLMGSSEALTYFHRTSPIGELLSQLEEREQKPPLAFIGLGVGTLASYGQSDQEVVFYEIDPEIIRIARNPEYFTYISDAEERGVRLQIISGDGRLQLHKAAPAHYGVIVLDAFSSDAIPVHLLTREAVQLYLSKLQPGGVLAFHVSNRYLELDRVLARLAQDLGLAGLRRYDNDLAVDGMIVPGKYSSDWVLLARRPEDFRELAGKPGWDALSVPPGAPLWTDDFTSLIGVYNWGRPGWLR